MKFLEKVNQYLKSGFTPIIPEFKLDILASKKDIESFGFSLVDFFSKSNNKDKNLIISLDKNIKRAEMWDVFQFFYFLSHNFEATFMLRADLETIFNFGVMPFGWEAHRVGIENVLVDDKEIEIKNLELVFNEFGLSGINLSLRRGYENFVTGFLFGSKDIEKKKELLYFKEVDFKDFNGEKGVILKTGFVNPSKEKLLILKKVPGTF